MNCSSAGYASVYLNTESEVFAASVLSMVADQETLQHRKFLLGNAKEGPTEQRVRRTQSWSTLKGFLSMLKNLRIEWIEPTDRRDVQPASDCSEIRRCDISNRDFHREREAPSGQKNTRRIPTRCKSVTPCLALHQGETG